MKCLTKAAITLILTASASLTITAPANAASRQIGVPAEAQTYSLWCWAASSRMVSRYLGGSSASQCQFVKWGKRTSSCPNVTGDFGTDVSSALLSAGIYSPGNVSWSAISFNTIKGQIDSNKPVLIRWQWSSGGGHMLVVKGYNTSGSTVTYIDPGNGSVSTRSYSWMKSASGHTWTHSRYNISR